jgi:hypothetical protein
MPGGSEPLLQSPCSPHLTNEDLGLTGLDPGPNDSLTHPHHLTYLI